MHGEAAWLYRAVVNEDKGAADDHDSFLSRNVPSVDVIGDFVNNGYWHTPQETTWNRSARRRLAKWGMCLWRP